MLMYVSGHGAERFTYVTIQDPGLLGPDLDREELDDILRRLSAGWPEAPGEVVVVRRLTGGRSSCDVFQAAVRWGNREAGKIIKVGPADALRVELDAYRTHLLDASALFAPIETATPGVRDPRHARSGVREALAYDFVPRFVGAPCEHSRTLADRVDEALRSGDGVDGLVCSIERLFEGVRSDLYDNFTILPGEQSLEVAMTGRLGPALEIEVDSFRRPRLTWGRPTDGQLRSDVRYPDDLFEAAVTVDAAIRPRDVVHLVGLRARWRGPRLFAYPCHDPRVHVELVISGGRSLQLMAPSLRSGDLVDVYGRVLAAGARARRERLLAAATGLEVANGVVSGGGATVPDPFPQLAHVLTERRPNRVVCTAHGDLNSRNILLVHDRPCVIDFADTAAGQPCCRDFATLESSLLRGPLAVLGWVDLVRLQRLLSVTSRIGDPAAEFFTSQPLEPRLAAAYRLLWAVRRAGRNAYPDGQRDEWWREHAVHLYLASHVALKHPSSTAAELRAAMAMGGVAVEMLEGRPRG